MDTVVLNDIMLRGRLVPTLARRATRMASGGPVQAIITARIQAALVPAHLAVENESHKHSVPLGSETHFKVFVVSEAFEGVPILERHRMVNGAVRNPETGDLPVHALSISAKTPAQWEGGAQMHKTPPCRGGAGK